MLESLKSILCTAAIAAGLGFAVGYDLHSRLTKADKFDAVVSAQEQTRTNVQQSLEQSAAIEVRATASTQQIDGIRKTVAKRIEAQHARSANAAAVPDAQAAQAADAAPVACVPWTLDVGTVGLLNAARTGADPGPAGGSDAEGEASSGLGPQDLIDNDLQVVQQYRDLAERHDALVDFVHSLIGK